MTPTTVAAAKLHTPKVAIPKALAVNSAALNLSPGAVEPVPLVGFAAVVGTYFVAGKP